jgi:phosphoribosylamine--glycine ligase
MSTSRAIGIVGIAATLAGAEAVAEAAAGSVRGPVDHRPDIGTADLVGRRIAHMKHIRGQ